MTATAENILHQVTILKTSLDPATYRTLCETLACHLEYEVNECDFGALPDGPIDTRTGHPRGCWCKDCYCELAAR